LVFVCDPFAEFELPGFRQWFGDNVSKSPWSTCSKEHLDFNLRRLKNNPTPERLNAVIATLDMGLHDDGG